MSYNPPSLQQAPPPWLRENGITQEDVQPLNTNVPVSTQSPEMLQKAELIHKVLRWITIALCLLMATTAIMGIRYINDVDAVDKIFVILYMFFFSILLLVFELNEIKKTEFIDHLYRRNFGFIYSVLGKAFFIIFIAFLCFGLGDPQLLTMLTGLGLLGFGSIQVGLYLKYPEFFETPVQPAPN